MSEFIDKLIGRLKERHEEVRNDYLYGEGNLAELNGTMRGIENAHAIIKSLEKEYKGCWIPCERELPKLGQTCLCSVNKKKYKDTKHDIVLCEYQELFINRWEDWFTAWMPLPAPYTEGE